MTEINRQWLLKRRPQNKASLEDFEFTTGAVPERALADNEILVKHMVFLCAPTMRNWMDPPSNSLYPSIPLGQPVMAPAVGRVIKSGDPKVKQGTRISTIGSWQDYEIINTKQRPVIPIADKLSYADAMGRFGLNSLTAYFGTLEVGQLKSGETMLVSGAAGSTGSVACQIGKIHGAKVIGIAGGADKCEWLTGTCGLDAAIDYKSENVAERVQALCPNGIDVFYDNVGGEILQAAVDNMAKFGRIVLCGQISSYDSADSPEGPRNMMRMVYGSVTMRGFLARDFGTQFPTALESIINWTEQGKIIHREDLREGFENLPEIYLALFEGTNAGTLLAQIASD
ncbi:MAG: NADP-dependent oxidoreductase [Pseudomonadota bacterium]